MCGIGRMRRTGNKALNGTRAQDDGLGRTKNKQVEKEIGIWSWQIKILAAGSSRSRTGHRHIPALLLPTSLKRSMTFTASDMALAAIVGSGQRPWIQSQSQPSHLAQKLEKNTRKPVARTWKKVRKSTLGHSLHS